MIRWITDSRSTRAGHNENQKARVENVGVLVASGLIAGEALMGLVTATFNFFEKPLPMFFRDPSYVAGLVVFLMIVYVMVKTPLANAGRPEESRAAGGNDVGIRDFGELRGKKEGKSGEGEFGEGIKGGVWRFFLFLVLSFKPGGGETPPLK